MTIPEDLQDYLQKQRATVDKALEHFLPSPNECPGVIAEAMRYSVFAGGKRLRPILTLATAEAVAETQQLVTEIPTLSLLELTLPAACAIELIHTYSLIHDDLPAMDNDILRRGHPTAHVIYGEGIAVLAGDGLLTQALGLVARNPEINDVVLNRRKLTALTCIAEAAGAAGMVGGQAIDLQVAGKIPDTSFRQFGVEDLNSMHKRKTSALIRAAAVAGAIMVGASKKIIDAIDLYGSHLGLAFQIVDDILDVEGTPAQLGKTTGKDAAAAKQTYPSMYGLQESHRLADQCIADARTTLESTKLGGRLAEIADWIKVRKS